MKKALLPQDAEGRAERTRVLEAAILRLVEENACLRKEAAELRARQARTEGRVDVHGQHRLPPAAVPSAGRHGLARHLNRARQLTADGVELLLEGIFYACHDWIVEGIEPVLDQDQLRRAVEPLMAGVTAGLRTEVARQGLSAGDLDARLRWPAGRTERLLAEPSELDFSESLLLCEVLGTTMTDLLPPREDADP